jgi:hypothetical protein
MFRSGKDSLLYAGFCMRALWTLDARLFQRFYLHFAAKTIIFAR